MIKDVEGVEKKLKIIKHLNVPLDSQEFIEQHLNLFPSLIVI